MPDISKYRELIRYQDFGAIEFARDEVRGDLELIEALVDEYWRLDTWEARSLVIQLVQDTQAEVSLPIMRDFLRAAVPNDAWADHIQTTKAIAVSHLEGDFEVLRTLIDDRDALKKLVWSHLAEQGESVVAAPDVGKPETA